jgi:Icc-related predicted phosphoesterase
MRTLVISNLAGHIDRLQAVAKHTQQAHVGAIFVLGNLSAGVARQPADTQQVCSGAAPYERPRAAGDERTTAVEMYARTFEVLGMVGAPVYLIPGGQDAPLSLFGEAIHAYRGPVEFHLVHRTAAYLDERHIVAGFGGAITTTPGNDPSLPRFPEWEVRVAFEYLAAANSLFQTAQRRIFLFATSPHGTRVDLQDGGHVGVPLLNWIIRVYQPHLVCCGGSERGRGVEVIEGSQVVNPGSLAAGSYALIDLDRLDIRLEHLAV